MTDQPNQLDLTTATPDQVEHMIWHLTEQHNCLWDTGFELQSIDVTDPELTRIREQLDYIEAEIDILEKHQRLICN